MMRVTTAGLSWFTVDAVGAAAPPDTGPLLLDLGDFGSDRTELVGAKAANLARASYAGLPVLPGFVVTTHAAARVRRGEQLPEQALRTRWKQLSGNGTRALIVRSSSVAEDSATSSMAGRFDSVLDVRGWDGFLDAVRQVVGSADAVGSDAPIAVLVQPMSTAQLGGVLFGLDPLTGDRRRLFASVVAGLPEEIVSGAATGTSVVLSRGLGRALETVGPQVPGLTAGLRYRLAALARRTRSVFGSPQDMEWLVDADGVLRLLQSRPVTAAAVPPRHSRPLGTAPIAETFPDALSTLERDLWQRPLDEGIRAALELSGAASRAVLSRPLVHSFGGRLAVDLAAIGAAPGPRRSWLDLIDPRTGLRKLRAAWRIGRLRTAFPMLVEDLVDQVDEQLAAIPDVVELPEDQLIYLLHNSSRMLTGLHAHEVLSGLFLDAQVHAPTGAELAAAEIARGRADGLDDAAIMARYPVAMVLLPPRIGPARPLPHSASTRFSVLRGREADDPQVALAVSREVLRIRVRWTQELMARAAMEIGARLHRHGQLRRPADIRHLRLSTVVDMVLDYELKPDLEPAAHQPGPPLPEVFRVAPDGTVVADTRGAGAVQGVSGGRTIAEITHDPGNAAGRILATEALHPALAAVLPEVAGIVSQSGSPLSHLAILARERGVPVVIGFTDVRAMFPEGLLVLLDGTNGTAEKYSLDSAERS